MSTTSTAPPPEPGIRFGDPGVPSWVGQVAASLPRTTDSELDLAAAARGLVQVLTWCAAQAADDRTTRTADELLEDVTALTAVTRSGEGVRALRLAQLALAERSTDPVTGQPRTVHHSPGWGSEFTPDEIAPALQLSPTAAGTLLEDSRDAVHKTPRLLEQVITGKLSTAALRAVTAELIEAPEATCATVEDQLLQHGITTMTPRQARHHARRAVGQVDPPAQRTGTRRRARASLGVWTEPGPEPGATDLRACLPSDQAHRLYAAIDTHARALHTDTTTGASLGECRANALLDLALHGAHVDTLIHLHLPVDATTSKNGTDCRRGATDTGANTGQRRNGSTVDVADTTTDTTSAFVRRPDGTPGHCTTTDFTRPGTTGHLTPAPPAGRRAPLIPTPVTFEHRPLHPHTAHDLPGTTHLTQLAHRRRWLLRCLNHPNPADGPPPQHTIEPGRDRPAIPTDGGRDDRPWRRTEHRWLAHNIRPSDDHSPPDDDWRGGDPWDPVTGWIRDADDPATHPTERHRWCHRCDRQHHQPVDHELPCPIDTGHVVAPETGTTASPAPPGPTADATPS